MIQKKEKETHAIILDFLPNGYPQDRRPLHQKSAIAQAIGKDNFSLLELIPKKGEFLQPYEEVYIGEEKREKIHHIAGRIVLSKLTETAKIELDFIIKDLVKKNENRFILFFNKAGPINIRMHQLELLPGIGKKHAHEIVEQRSEKEFESLEDIKKRVKLLPDPEKVVIKRIYVELNNEDKHRIFTG